MLFSYLVNIIEYLLWVKLCKVLGYKIIRKNRCNFFYFGFYERKMVITINVVKEGNGVMRVYIRVICLS